MTLPRSGGPELPTGQNASPETMNEALRWVEQGANKYIVEDRTTTPPGSPVDGDTYIVTATATGAWTGEENNLAFYMSTSWEFITPIEGTEAYVQDENLVYRYSGSAWAIEGMASSQITTNVRTVSGTSDTPTVADANGVIEFTNAGAITLTIPTNASQAFPVGSFIEIHQAGAGAVTPTPDGGVTLDVRSGFTETAGQYAIAALRKVATNTWRLTGDLT